jgi:hypothetical protein
MTLVTVFKRDRRPHRSGARFRLRGPESGPWISARGVVVLTLVAAFGALMLGSGISMWRDRSILLERGHVVTAEVVRLHGGTRGTSATVRFTTTAGETVVTRLTDPPTGQSLDPGAPLQIRYDPDDPAGRVMAVNENQAVFTRWFRAGSGVVLLALVGFGIWWWTRRPAR